LTAFSLAGRLPVRRTVMHVIRAVVLAAITAISFYLLGGAPAATAAPPQSVTFPFTDVGVVANCTGFDVIGAYEGKITITTFFDNNGVPVRRHFHGVAFGTMTNSVTTYSVKDAATVRNSFVDFAAGTVANVGVDYHVTVPGAGVVLLQAGRIVFGGGPAPIFIAGPHLGPPPVQEAAICAALNH
jgi:hypothetical protein